MTNHKIMEKKIIIIIGVILIIASIITNIYFISWKKIELKIYNRGINEAVISISNRVRNNGQVILPVFKLKEGLWIQDGEMILIPKINQETENKQ